MNRLLSPALACMLALAAIAPACAQSNAADKKSAPAKKRPAPAKPAVPVENAPVETLNHGQLAAADRVFTGRASCEFKQAVDVHPVNGRPGHFDVHFGKRRYRVVPEETTTGAVRLHDRRTNVVWLQIPVKSMLLDGKSGHRLVDACQHPQQVAEVRAIEQAHAAAEAAKVAATAAGNAATMATATSGTTAAAATMAAEKAAMAASADAAAASAAAPEPTGGIGSNAPP